MSSNTDQYAHAFGPMQFLPALLVASSDVLPDVNMNALPATEACRFF